MNAIDRLQVYVGERQLSRMDRPMTRLRAANAGLTLAGLLMVSAVDATGSDVSMCAYSFSGEGSGIGDVVESIEVNASGIGDMLSRECTPSISS